MQRASNSALTRSGRRSACVTFPASHLSYESGTKWGRLRGECRGVGWSGEAGVPAVEVAGELVVEHVGAYLQQQVGAALRGCVWVTVVSPTLGRASPSVRRFARRDED